MKQYLDVKDLMWATSQSQANFPPWSTAFRPLITYGERCRSSKSKGQNGDGAGVGAASRVGDTIRAVQKIVSARDESKSRTRRNGRTGRKSQKRDSQDERRTNILQISYYPAFCLAAPLR